MTASSETSRFSRTTPADRELVERSVADHLPRFGQVLVQAWGAFATARRLAPDQLVYAGASARGMLVSDFTREPAHRIFAQVADASVEDDKFTRPWISLAAGSIRVRFRKLTTDLALCRSDSMRALGLAYHLGDPCLPGMEPFTVLTAGYVLDGAEENIERLELVCHLGFNEVLYSFPVPLATAATGANPGSGSFAGPVQLPLAPLSRPIIRSAQTAAASRLAAGAGPSPVNTSTTGGRDV